MGFIKRSWKGEEKLWKVFWIYGLVFGIILGILMSVASASMGSAGIALLVVWLVYYIWLAVAQWRCAFNADWKIWGYVVRILLILSLVMFVLGIATGGLLVGNERLKAAECRKEMKEYIAQGGKDPEQFLNDCQMRQMQEQEQSQQSSGGLIEQVKNAAESAVKYTQQCEQTLIDHAIKNNTDPKSYVEQNQQYIRDCVKYHMDQDAAAKP
ncbi:MAG: hypothetical protein LW823_05165 [Rickettsiales bacterium]|jgi:hypothetical protein|nr:hypothetical protein [Rickettsiales bacterium]